MSFHTYEGDYVLAEYKLGAMMSVIMGATVGLGLAGTVQNPFDSVSNIAFGFALVAAGAILGYVGGALAKFTVGNKVENSGEIWPNRRNLELNMETKVKLLFY